MNVENILSELIRIESVNPPGGETAVAIYLKKLFDGYGIPCEVIESAPGRGSFVATLGEGTKSMLFLSHIDVVPVSEGWSFKPFSGEIKDGFVYGRGALDCKGLAAAEAFAMLTLAQTAQLKGKLIFAATADEEAGGGMGAQFIARKSPEKLRADFCVNEGAEAPMTINGKPCHFISIGEKSPCWMSVRTTGVAGHGSVPYLPNNAVVKMAKVIDALAAYKSRVVLTPEARHLIQSIADLTGFGKKVAVANLEELLGTLEDRDLASYLRAITRMTVSPNVVRGGIKTNIVPDWCEAEIDIRILPGQDREYAVSQIKPLLGDAEIGTIQYSLPTISPTDTPAYTLVVDTMKEFLGNAPVLPTLCAGATDSRYTRELGIPSYGIGMMTYRIDTAMKASVHGKDEKLDVQSLRLKSDMLVALAKKYLG